MTRQKAAAAAAVGIALAAGMAALWLWNERAIPQQRALQEDTAPQDGAYTCSMHPQIVQSVPGNCPICGMALMPARRSPAEPPGVTAAGVTVSPHFTQNFAVSTTAVVRGHLPMSIRTVGYLDHDEARVVSVSTKFAGWIERSHFNTVGEQVSEGDLLFEVYSPELVAAQQECVSAADFARRLRSAGATDDAVERAESLHEAALERLRFQGLTDSQLGRLRADAPVPRLLEVYAPASGVVMAKAGDTLEGAHLTPGAPVIKIADHSTLWAKVEFHEHSVQHLRAGLRAEIRLDAYPGREWSGELLFFQPAMNPHTQTLTGFVAVDNAEGSLRPKMYAEVRILLPGVPNAVVVPSQSVLHTGGRSVVVIAGEGGRFVPREVEVGAESDGRVHVVSGVEPGERVVTSSQFLFDSESNLRTSLSQLLEAGGAEGAPHIH